MLMLGYKESTVPLLGVKGLRAETPITTLKNERPKFRGRKFMIKKTHKNKNLELSKNS